MIIKLLIYNIYFFNNKSNRADHKSGSNSK